MCIYKIVSYKTFQTIWIFLPWSFAANRIDLRFETSNMSIIKNELLTTSAAKGSQMKQLEQPVCFWLD